MNLQQVKLKAPRSAGWPELEQIAAGHRLLSAASEGDRLRLCRSIGELMANQEVEVLA
jgi:hypothetical protein